MNIKKRFIQFVIPSIAAMLVFNLYTMVDGIFVANFVGETALAAVNISMPFVNFIFAFSLLFSIGASTLISIFRGQEKLGEANKLFTMNTVVLSCASILISLFTIIFSEQFAYFLGAEADTLTYVMSYIQIIGGFSFFFIVAYSFEVLIKADGFPKYSTFGIVLGAVTNIVLDALFVIVFQWGIAGAAWATGISQAITFLFFISHFLFSKKTNFHFTRFKPDFKIYKKLIPIGVADCITELSAGIIVFAFNHQIMKFIGTSGIVSYTVITYVYNLVLMAMVGISQGMQPMVSYYVGKKDKKTTKLLFRYGLVTVFIVSMICMVISLVLAPQIVSVFISPEETALFQSSIRAFRLYSGCYLVMGYNVLSSGYFVALAKPKFALTISISRGIVVILVCLFTMSALFGADGIWISPLVSELLCLLISGLILWKSTQENQKFLEKVAC